MRRKTVGIGLLLVILLAAPASLVAGRSYHFQSFDFTLDVADPESFRVELERNPNLPVSEEEILDLARKFYPPAGARVEPGEGAGVEPGTAAEMMERGAVSAPPTRGVAGAEPLWAALRNPDLDDGVRERVDQVLASAKPDLPLFVVSPKGYFKFHYTKADADPDQNVTPAAVNRTAVLMDGWWDLFVARKFKEPKHRVLADSRKRIDVYIYNLGLVPAYRVNPSRIFMELDSQAVLDSCARSSETAAAVFGRVMAAYGYSESIHPNTWPSYASLATWAKKFASAWVGDYLDEMNVSIAQWGYTHFWVYLAEIGGVDKIRLYLESYEGNGGNPLDALNRAFNGGDPMRRFQILVDQWNRANYCKDLLEIPESLGYAENRSRVRSCGAIHGPLGRVEREKILVESPSSSYKRSEVLDVFTAKYYEITWKSNVPRMRITIIPNKIHGAVYCSFLGVRGASYERLLSYEEVESGESFTYRTDLPFSDGINKIVVVVSALEAVADPSLLVGLQNDACVTGKWAMGPTPQSGECLFNLVLRGMSVSGIYMDNAYGCGSYRVKGWFDPPDIEFTISNPNAPEGCEKDLPPFVGTVSDSCSQIIRNYYGPIYYFRR